MSGVTIYNTETQKLEPFETITPGQVKMYVCGPTVYDLLHVGNFRGPIFFNLVRNWFVHKGFEVQYIYNYTDVDDKIIYRAEQDHVASHEISARYIDEFESDFKKLKLTRHTANPRVTEHMSQIIDFVKGLIDCKKAYEVDGDVYYDVTSFEGYGKLSHKNLDDLAAGFRIEVDPRKHHVSDFALWKKAKPDEPSWPSPWGEGRPGWHIECSAMARSLLGDSIDIHGGGMDLIFPHHENEIAQSEGLTGRPFVRYWMHNNMIQFGKAKMSKSLGNIVTGRGFMESYNPETLKFMMLSAHYRSPLDLSDTAVTQAITALARIYSALALADQIVESQPSVPLVPIPSTMTQTLEEAEDGFAKALDSDFGTPEAMARIFEVVRVFNGLARKPGKLAGPVVASADVFRSFVRKKGELMSLFQEPAREFLISMDNLMLQKMNLSRQQIQQKIDERNVARAAKDFAKSDQLRDELTQLGIRLLDGPQGTVWEVEK